MSTSAPLRHRAPRHRAEWPAEAERTPSRYAGWAWGLIALTLPAGAVAVLLFEAAAAVTGLGPGEVARAWESLWLFAAVTAPLLASIAVGVRGWRREHEPLALRAALLSAWLLAVGTTLVLMS